VGGQEETVRMMENSGRIAGDIFIIRTRADGGELVAGLGGMKLMWWRGGEDKVGIREAEWMKAKESDAMGGTKDTQ